MLLPDKILPKPECVKVKVEDFCEKLRGADDIKKVVNSWLIELEKRTGLPWQVYQDLSENELVFSPMNVLLTTTADGMQSEKAGRDDTSNP